MNNSPNTANGINNGSSETETIEELKKKIKNLEHTSFTSVEKEKKKLDSVTFELTKIKDLYDKTLNDKKKITMILYAIGVLTLITILTR